MSNDENDSRAGPALILQPVLEARQRLAREDLVGMGPRQLLDEAQSQRDLHVMWRRARSKDALLDFVLGDLDALSPSDSDVDQAAERSALKWLPKWRLFDRRLRRATRIVASLEGVTVDDIRWRALCAGIFLALHDAGKPQAIRLGDDQVVSWGSKLVRRQKKDLERRAMGEVNDALLERLAAPPVGIRVYPGYRLIESPIVAAMMGFDPCEVRPTDLRPRAFRRWFRRRVIAHAEEWLRDAAEIDALAPHQDWRRVDVIEGDSDEEDAPTRDAEQLMELDLLEALDRAHPDPLRRIIDQERVAEALEAATPAERKYIELLDLFHVQNGLPKAESIKAIAKERGVKVNTVHQTLLRFVKKVRG